MSKPQKGKKHDPPRQVAPPKVAFISEPKMAIPPRRQDGGKQVSKIYADRVETKPLEKLAPQKPKMRTVTE